LVSRALLKIVYVLACRILSLVAVLCRGDQPIVVEVLVLRHENAVLRREAGRVRTSRRTEPGHARCGRRAVRTAGGAGG
jgi:hypothetical protein